MTKTKEKIEKRCAYCGKSFLTQNRNRKYCSPSCKLKHDKQKLQEEAIIIVNFTFERKQGFLRRLLSYIW